MNQTRELNRRLLSSWLVAALGLSAMVCIAYTLSSDVVIDDENCSEHPASAKVIGYNVLYAVRKDTAACIEASLS